MPAPPAKPGFPVKTALAIATVAISLAIWHRRVARPPGLDWHTLPEVAKLSILRRQPRATRTKTPEPNVQGSGADLAAQPPGALLIDNAGSLDRFYAALARLDHHAPEAQATVIHFGDSPTTADLITGDVREQLQQRFGDAGQGFNLIAKPWAWYQHRDIDETDHGWKFSTAVGFMREGPYGIGGASFDGSAGAYTRYKLSGASPTAVDLAWQSQPNGGKLSLAAGDRELASIDTSKPPALPAVSAPAPGDPPAKPTGDPAAPLPVPLPESPPGLQFQTVQLPPETRVVELRVAQGPVRLYGISFNRDRPGLLYDSIGLNGASVTVLSRALPEDMMKRSFQHLHPDIIVINYGTNEAGFAAFIGKQYEGELRTAIARVREAAPNASILLMAPMDRGERGDGNSIQTMPTIPKIVAIQQRVAADTGCAFFNSYQAMGGEGTMQRWYEGKPRLVGGDLIHPTPQGAKIVATAFVDQLLLGYARYQSRTAKQASTPAPAVQ
jgi:lysophospholipase L1-like esterase